jgi:imidazole glycerol-phosphate synthase subunit HisH
MTARSVTILDYGVGNIGSLRTMLLRSGAMVSVATSADQVREARRLVLPGVGAFDYARRRLEESGLRGALDEAVLDAGVPVLGICVGLQLMTAGSEEGRLPGLGWFGFSTVRFRPEPGLRVPHIGWNGVETDRLEPWHGATYYFMHSFHVDEVPPGEAAGYTNHGGYRFVSVVERENILGVQFHPEKSQAAGRDLLQSWAR